MLGVSSVIRQAGADSVVIDGLADSVDTTGAIHLAGVLADTPDAHFQEGAVLVVPAARDAVSMAANASYRTVSILEARSRFPNLFALNLSITLEARGTGAQSAVVARLTVSVQATNVGQAADILALAIHTGFFLGTVVIMATALYATVVVTYVANQALGVPCALWLRFIFDTYNVGVSPVARKAGAVSVVVDWSTQSVATTGAEHTARVLTDAIDAGLFRSTALICPAAENAFVAFANMSWSTVSVNMTLFRWFGWHWSAFYPGITNETSFARTYGSVGCNYAKCVDTTSPRDMAEVLALSTMTGFTWQALIIRTTPIDTLLVLTDLTKGAVIIPLAAFFSLFRTVDVWIPRESREANADGAVVCRTAVCVDAAHSCKAARVLAAVADARLVVRTRVVRAAGIHAEALLAYPANRAVVIMVAELLPRDNTFNVGVAAKSGWARANRLVADRKTLGILATDTRAARVATLAADAGLIKRAVRIATAALNTVVCFANLPNMAVTVVNALWWRLHLNSTAIVVWISFKVRLACAQRAVHNWTTIGILATRVVNVTRVDALRVDAGLVERAVCVAAASNCAFAPFADFSRVASRICCAAVHNTDTMATEETSRARIVSAALSGNHLCCGRGTVDFGVPDLVPGTGTSRPVVVGPAEGIDPTTSTQ